MTYSTTGEVAAASCLIPRQWLSGSAWDGESRRSAVSNLQGEFCFRNDMARPRGGFGRIPISNTIERAINTCAIVRLRAVMDNQVEVKVLQDVRQSHVM